ncbi:hypothetical protein B0T22DRAFT_110442 [Podospora appendiculata]|uniref:Uncharacterized protein n=1 Tax=Podospora appendiculata TaxID=314037 RepID=A0AAE0XLK2_9PEZI|nr:hypothetical protein B0T22DRAFT_110442 [Podospora appendiculata]
MSAVARLPTESFWPSGSIESDLYLPLNLVGSESSSVISPLALPRGGVGYFDLSASNKSASQTTSATRQPFKIATHGSLRGSRVYSPLSPGTRGPAASQQAQFLSPHLTPITRDMQRQTQQQRSSSVPPNHHRVTRNSFTSPPTSTPPTSGLYANGVGNISNGATPPINSVSAGHPRTTSADALGAPSHAQMIRRLVQQNGRIREAWEAERKYLEANRERAEEVYKEERALMEEERVEWEAEKVELLQEIVRLQQQVSGLEGNTRRSRGASFANTKVAYVPSHSLRGGGGWEASPESMRSSQSSQGNHRNIVNSTAVSHYQQQSERGPFSPAQLPTSSSLDHSSLGPLVASGSPSFGPFPDLSGSLEVDEGPIPVVDVQEIHPELEGIPIKASNIQKSTFTDHPSQNGSKTSSRASSPPTDPVRPRVSPRGSKEQTLQVLAAHESDRLTMHAGHTPSHSLSVLPTMSSSGTTTASSSGDSTPKMHQGDGPNGQALATIPEAVSTFQDHATEPFPPAPTGGEQFTDDGPAPIHEPTEDRELKGPLMLRNMPIHDEIFFQKLSDKLEEVSKDSNAALPAVLKDTSSSTEVVEQPKMEAKPDALEAGSNHSDAGTEKGGSPKSGDEQELEIPLKIKKSFNFGAPFGECR